ncbi:MAG: sigma-54 dependent transcriptional regulator [Deltaproteobacteria bacterium]|nr:sigma-54 dependent transcriptional regulator [Deltaproteobacteria bacterium]
MQRARILVVDDEANARNALFELLKEEGYAVETAADGFKALGKMSDFTPDLVLTDLKMPGMDGLELLRRVRESDEDAVVVVMTAFGAVETAVTAMRNGAADYLTKPINMNELLLVLNRELEHLRLRKESGQLKARLAERYKFENIIGSAPVMQEIFKVISQVATSRASVLITGESGTGKELIAAAIHQRSPRATGPFVKLHCAALAETILESELFGHERGSFTGAAGRRDGRFMQAHKGTLFLDEIGEISPATQVKLLRFLQEHEFERVGGNETVRVDVRVIAATNRDLKAEVAAGRFREDLYYRLNVINMEMPPLRSRPSDVPLLASYFLRKYAAENERVGDRTIEGFTDDALEFLANYQWPGNVRELENTIERAVVMCNGRRVGVSELPPHLRPKESRGIQIPGSTLEEIENYAIRKTLELTGGSTSKAADVLGISVRKVQYKLHEYQEAPKSGAPAVSANKPD